MVVFLTIYIGIYTHFNRWSWFVMLSLMFFFWIPFTFLQSALINILTNDNYYFFTNWKQKAIMDFYRNVYIFFLFLSSYRTRVTILLLVFLLHYLIISIDFSRDCFDGFTVKTDAFDLVEYFIQIVLMLKKLYTNYVRYLFNVLIIWNCRINMVCGGSIYLA